MTDSNPVEPLLQLIETLAKTTVECDNKLLDLIRMLTERITILEDNVRELQMDIKDIEEINGSVN